MKTNLSMAKAIASLEINTRLTRTLNELHIKFTTCPLIYPIEKLFLIK